MEEIGLSLDIIPKLFCLSEQESSVLVSRISKDFTVCNDALETLKAGLYCMVVDVPFSSSQLHNFKLNDPLRNLRARLKNISSIVIIARKPPSH